MGDNRAWWRLQLSDEHTPHPKEASAIQPYKQLAHGKSRSTFTDFSYFKMLPSTTQAKPNISVDHQPAISGVCAHPSLPLPTWAPPQAITCYNVISCTGTNNDAYLYSWCTSQCNSAEAFPVHQWRGNLGYFPIFSNTEDPVSSQEGNIHLLSGDKNLWICRTMHALR